MSSAARRRAWAPPSRRLPVVAVAATLGLLLAPAAAVGSPAQGAGVTTTRGMPSPPLSLSLPAQGVVPAGAATALSAGAVQDGTDQEDDPGEVAESEEVGLRVVLDSVTPVVLRPDSPATLSGRVINSSTSAARLSGVTLSASTSTLGSRQEVMDWVERGVDRTTGWVLGEDTVGPLVPGEGEVGFSVTVPGATLGALPDGPAAVAVRIRAGTDGDGSSEGREDGAVEGAELRTVLTSSAGDAVDIPLQMSWVVPLTLPPDPDLVNPDPAAHARAWTEAVGADSAARTWLDHLRLPDVTWLVDPALLVAPRPEPSIASATPDEDEGGDVQTDEGETPQGETTNGETTTGDPPGGRSGSTGPRGGTGDGTGTSTRTGDGSEDDGTATGPPPDGTATGQPPDDGTATEPPADGPPGEETPDEVAQALDELRERLAKTPEDGLWWLPTGDPDLARLASDPAPSSDRVEGLLSRSAPGEEVPAAVTALLRRGRGHVLWPALTGPTTDDLRRVLDLFPADAGPSSTRSLATSPARPEVVLVQREAFTASSAVAPRRGAVPVDDTGVVALGADSWTSALVAGSPAEAQDRGAGAAAQHLLAHTLGTWLESPSAARELVVAPPRGTTPSRAVLDQLGRAWSDAGWLSTVPAEELLARADGDPVSLSGTAPQELVIGERASLLVPGDSPVDGSRGRDLARLADDLQGVSEILRDTDALRSWAPALDGLWSTRWRQEPEAWPVTWRALSTDVRQSRSAVHVAASNVNFIADQGTVHVTVVNDLPVAVDGVRLAVSASNGRLQVLRQPDPLSVGPGSRTSVPFDARAVTRGEVTLGVALTTPGGTELGVDEQIAVRVQPTGVWIYWVLGGLAGVVLVLGLARALPGPRRVPGGAPAGAAAYPDPGPPTAAGEETP